MKRLLSLLATLVILMSLPVLCTAYYNELPKVVDNAGVLTETELSSLNAKAEIVSEKYQCDVVVVFVPTLNGMDIADFTDDLYVQNRYGYGSTEDGVILLVSLQERQTYISTEGKGIDIITDYGIDNIFDEIIPYMKEGRWNTVTSRFISCCDDYFNQYESTGHAYDIDNERKSYFNPTALIAGGGLGALLSGLPLRKKKKEMESVKPKRGAEEYMLSRSFRITGRNDYFINKSVARTPIMRDPRPSSHSGGGMSHGGGSTIHMSSSGHTHGGGGHSF